VTTRLRRTLINSNPGLLLIKGGPGTGKTVVALHRVAYLLYTRLRAKIATCYDKLAIVYRAAAILHAVMKPTQMMLDSGGQHFPE
jgi:superfamily I DNA and RNA helicase